MESAMRLLVLLLSILISGRAWSANQNLITDSSFEVLGARGWTAFGGSLFTGNNQQGLLLTNDAFHGGHSLVAQIATHYSRAVYLTNGSYTPSMYAKCSVNGAGPFYWGIVNNDTTNAAGAVTALGDVVPPYSNNVASTWTRYTGPTFVANSNAFYWFKCYTVQSSQFLIDAIQLEPGTSATAYAPQATVECGLSSPMTNNIWFSGDTPVFQLNFWNEGSAANYSGRYQIFDLWNSNVVSANYAVALTAATNTVSTINLPSRTGHFRIVNRLYSTNDSWDEMTYVIYPFSSNITASAASDWLGGHPQSSKFHTRREMLVGRKYARLLSPCYASLRWDTIEPSRGSITFSDSCITNIGSSGLITIGTLTPTDGVWPTWATNADGTADLMAFSNYCYTVVNRYKAYCTNWEIGPNEPYQSGPYGTTAFTTDSRAGLDYTGTNLPINVRVATNYARVLTYGLQGVTNADATAQIIAIAGSYGSGEWGYKVWTNLTAASQAAIAVISTHIYPKEHLVDPNPGVQAVSTFTNPYGWMTNFGGIRPVWNTESGQNGIGPIKGLNGMWPSANYDIQTVYADDASRSERMNRQIVGTQAVLTECLRAIGYGFSKFIYYDSRMFQASSFNGTQPYAADYMQVDRPEIVSLSIATKFLSKGLGRVTNSTAALEMYCFTNYNSGQVGVTAWCYDKTNRTLTLDNGAFAGWDCMGNFLYTNSTSIKITRLPQYFTSGTRTLTQLSNTFGGATVAGTVDVLPPNISFDIAPTGLWTGDTNRQLVKWTSLDDTWTAWPTNLSSPTAGPSIAYSYTNVVYKYKLDSGSYSTPSSSNMVWLTQLSSGDHFLYVTAIDRDGNSAEQSYEFFVDVSTNAYRATIAGGVVIRGAVNLNR